MSDRWLSVGEIAEYLGVSKDTVYAWISKRKMPSHRIGRLWKFKSEEVDGWVRSGGAQKMMVEATNDCVAIYGFRSVYPAIEISRGLLK